MRLGVVPGFTPDFFIIHLMLSPLDNFSLKNVATKIFFHKFGY